MTEAGYIERRVEPLLRASLDDARVTCLVGPRQAGKSTLAERVAADRAFASVVSLDQVQVREAAQRDPAGFLASLPTPALIDEIQRAPDLLLEIKHRVDRDNRSGQYLITGSADVRSLASVRDALPGRADYVTLLPLTQAEIAEGAVGNVVDALFDGAAPLVRGAEAGIGPHVERLYRGGFPEALRRSERTLPAFRAGYTSALLDRDLRDVAGIRRPDAFGRLLSLVAARSGGLLNRARFARDAGIDDKTVVAHLDTMERMYLLLVLRSWHVNIGTRYVKSPKVHVGDTGLLAQLTGADAARLVTTDHVGRTLETFVACELARLACWAAHPTGLHHYRDQDGHKVDVVLERGDGSIVGVEVKAAATVRGSDVRDLEFLRDRAGDRFACGVVVHLGTDTVPLGDRIWALPLSVLWS